MASWKREHIKQFLFTRERKYRFRFLFRSFILKSNRPCWRNQLSEEVFNARIFLIFTHPKNSCWFYLYKMGVRYLIFHRYSFNVVLVYIIGWCFIKKLMLNPIEFPREERNKWTNSKLENLWCTLDDVPINFLLWLKCIARICYTKMTRKDKFYINVDVQ